MKIGLDSEVYLFDTLPKNFDLMNKQYDPLEICKLGTRICYKENDPLLGNFINMLTLNKFGLYATPNSTYLAMLDIGAVSRNVYNEASAFRMDSAVGTSSNYGPVVGTGLNAVTRDDSKLQTQILSGITASTLLHGIVQLSSTPYTVGSSRFFLAGRTFTNLSGGDITINEMGLYVQHATGPYYYCIARDSVNPGVTILNQKVGYFQYKFQITV
jgi:hypothetical protein